MFLKDLGALLFLAKFIEFIIPSFRRLKPTEVINHFERLVREELDLRMEISAAAEFAENTKSDRNFYVPKVMWSLSGKRVITTEWVDGISVGDIERIKKSGVDIENFLQKNHQNFFDASTKGWFFTEICTKVTLNAGVMVR